jgi:predicted Zn-dependent protease
VSLYEKLEDVLDALQRKGLPEAEVYAKRGRSRVVRWSAELESIGFRQEEGWAARAGDRRRSFFYTATGAPDPEISWPEADGEGLRLATGLVVPAWTPPVDFDLPLLGETESQQFVAELRRELDREYPGAELLSLELDDGASEAGILSSREVRHLTRQRLAVLRVEARCKKRPATSTALRLIARSAKGFRPATVARRLADLLVIAAQGEAPLRDRGDFLLAPQVFATLLESLLDLFVGPAAAGARAPLLERQATLGSKLLTLIDNGRLPGGPFDAPVDGEGLPTREIVVVEQGLFRQSLLDWREAKGAERPSGCTSRPSWRDLPSPGPTHFFLAPHPNVSVGQLLGSLQRGYYLLATRGGVRLEKSSLRFAVAVEGFAIEKGKAATPISGGWLTGSIKALFGGLQAVGRDLAFVPARKGLVGSPTVLVRGLEIRGAS